VGEPLKDFHGVLAGTPTYTGKLDDLINRDNDQRGNDG
jgi:hypothetical protein